MEKSVRCMICGRETSDWMSFQLEMLLLCRYKNLRDVIPANTLAEGSVAIELSERSIFFKELKF